MEVLQHMVSNGSRHKAAKSLCLKWPTDLWNANSSEYLGLQGMPFEYELTAA